MFIDWQEGQDNGMATSLVIRYLKLVHWFWENLELTLPEIMCLKYFSQETESFPISKPGNLIFTDFFNEDSHQKRSTVTLTKPFKL